MLVCAKEEVWKLRYIKLCICYKKAPKGFRFNISEAHGVGTMVNRDQKDLQRTLGFQGHSKRLPKWHSWVKTHLPVGHKWEDIRDMGSIPGLERFPGEGNGYPLQYSCLENPMDRGAWWATTHGVTQNWTQLK